MPLIVILCIIFSFQLLPAVLVIDAAGDARYTGRCIDDTFERGLTLQCAQELKRVLESRTPSITTLLTRVAGEQVSDLYNVQFTNRIRPQLYVNINFFHEHEVIPRVYLYTYRYTSEQQPVSKTLAFHTLDTIHTPHMTRSFQAACTVHELLSSTRYAKRFHCHSPISCPYMPLMGINTAAIALEVGLRNKDDWRSLIEPLAQAIIAYMESL